MPGSVVTGFLLLLFCSCGAQQKITSSDTVVEAKEWLKDEDGHVRYKDWRPYASRTMERLGGFRPSAASLCHYGGNTEMHQPATGFFHTRSINGRWWMIDPHGHPVVVNAVNSIRIGKSAAAAASVSERFGDKSHWCSATIDSLRSLGFNAAGSWSDTAALLAYNRSTTTPFAYTTQLNLLSGFAASQRKANPAGGKRSILLHLLDEQFPAYCAQQLRQLAYLKNDPSLLGHFSDNELSFTRKELQFMLSKTDTADIAYRQCLGWMRNRNMLAASLSDEQQDEVLGWLASQYYQVVGSSIRKYDPQHIYLGSRLHGSVKNNRYVYTAALPYIDVISVNYYGNWQPSGEQLARWMQWGDKPFFITEFYTKGADTGMPNSSGAGWIVRNQADRGVHYQNFCLSLLAAQNCIGWHWFRYQDNDATDSSADESNLDSNKGMVDIRYGYYLPLTARMRQLNLNKYALVEYFDKSR